MRNNRVMLKTLGGLLPVEVLLRRVEDHDCDPAELIGSSNFGVSGLLEVVRSGHVAIANSIGSSLSESPMLLAFLPLIAGISCPRNSSYRRWIPGGVGIIKPCSMCSTILIS